MPKIGHEPSAETEKLHSAIQTLLADLPRMIKEAVREEFDFRKNQLQPLTLAARFIGISPTVAHTYKKQQLLAGKMDRFGKITPHDLLTIHLLQGRS